MTRTVHRASWVLPIAAEPIRFGAVAVEGGQVVEVGTALSGDRYVDHAGVLLPGLVNAHAHLQYGPAFADLATSGMPFPQWLAEMARRRQEQTDEAWYENAKQSAALALSAGTTTIADIVSNPAAARGRGQVGGISYVESVAVDDVVWAEYERERMHAALGDVADAGVSPHTPYTVGTAVFRDLVELARERGLRLHPHLAESVAECEFVRAGTGPFREMVDSWGLRMELAAAPSGLTPTAYFESLGALGADVHVAHGVHVDAADRAILRRTGTAVALCVRSNAILQAGSAPVAAYRAEGNPVAIGTDALCSTPDLDLLAEARAVRALALGQGSPPAGLDAWLVTAVTRGGAAALGRDDIGVLVPGARADLVVVERTGSEPGSDPGADPYSAVLDGRATATYLAGEEVARG